MEFLDPAKKKAHSRRLFIGYFLVAVAISAALWLLVLYARGYDINHKTGQIVQNGIVLVSSHPVSANVYLNGVKQGTTSLKLNIQSGSYSLRLSQVGYRDWQRSFNLEGGTVLQLRYPYLFPSKLITTNIKTYTSAPLLASQSLDQRWLLIQPKGNINHFDEFDLNNPDVPASINLPAGLLTKTNGNQKLSVIEWSLDNRHLLVNHIYHGGQEYIMLDRSNPINSINLNRLFNISPSSVELRGGSSDQLYIYSSRTKQLSLASISAKTNSPVLNKVLYFKPFGSNQLVYVTPDPKISTSYSLNIWDMHQSYHLHDYPANNNYHLAMASFNGADYLAVSPQKTGIVYIYKNPLNQARSKLIAEPFKTLRLKQTSYLSFSTGSRFIAAQNGRYFAIYDIDNDSRHYYSLNQNIDPAVQANWMDDDHLDISSFGKIMVFDFDGSNRQTLNSSLAGFTAYFSPDYSQLFSVSTTADLKDFALAATALKVK